MSEPTVPAIATCSIATGGFTATCLAAAGINPTDMIAGLVGCVIVQCLIKPQPNEARTFKGIAAMTLGGMLLASLAAPVAGPWFLSAYPAWAPNVPPPALRALLAGAIGGFAQAIVALARSKIVTPAQREKEQQNA